MLYSIVNSLCELPEIDSVRFFCEGEKIGTYCQTDLSDVYKRQIVHSLRNNMTTLSLGLAVSVVVLSIVVSWLFSSRMRKIMVSIKALRSGNYEQKLDIRGTDELGLLAAEFNKLTDRLETKEQEQRQFVSDASHELKTPLASIRLLTDSILQNQMDKQTMLEFVEDIGNEADRLTRVSEKLLTLSKIDNTQGEMCIRDSSDPALTGKRGMHHPMPYGNPGV